MRRTLVGRDGVFDQAWRALGEPGWVLLEGPAGYDKRLTELARTVAGRL